MYHSINVNSNQDVEIQFDVINCNRILKTLEKKVENKIITQNEADQIKESLEKLKDINFNLDAYITDVDINEDEIDTAYGEIHKYGTYNDGYNDGINHILNYKKEVQYKHGLLLQKLEHLCFNYGKQEELTKDELKTIRDLLYYEYKDGQV
jgi:DNA repair ATPase RecN